MILKLLFKNQNLIDIKIFYKIKIYYLFRFHIAFSIIVSSSNFL